MREKLTSASLLNGALHPCDICYIVPWRACRPSFFSSREHRSPYYGAQRTVSHLTASHVTVNLLSLHLTSFSLSIVYFLQQNVYASFAVHARLHDSRTATPSAVSSRGFDAPLKRLNPPVSVYVTATSKITAIVIIIRVDTAISIPLFSIVSS